MAPKIFEGLKILDMCWIGIGPVTIKYFAEQKLWIFQLIDHTNL